MHKRLFFACEVSAPWQEKLPPGRILSPPSRHMTLAFLGNVDYEILQAVIPSFPKPAFMVGPTGFFDRALFLPEQHPHVVAWHVQWDEKGVLEAFQQVVVEWLRSHEYNIDRRPLLSHVTIARNPFDREKWQKDFVSLPMHVKGIHLYESIGNLIYKPVWSFPIFDPFVELSHTADFAFLVQAESIQGIHLHANNALAFKFPPLLRYMQKVPLETSLNDIIIALNTAITACDSEIGCPLKAVSFHGDVRVEQGVCKWEMIIDV